MTSEETLDWEATSVGEGEGGDTAVGGSEASVDEAVRSTPGADPVEAAGVDEPAASFTIESGGRRIFFTGDTGYGPAFRRIGDRLGDIADESRLEFRVTAADQRQHRRDAGKRGESVEETVFRPEQDRGAHDHRLRLRRQHQPFRGRLGASIGRR